MDAKAQEVFNRANSAFVDENYDTALQDYNLLFDIVSQPTADMFLKRSACHAKLENFVEAISDANNAIKLAPQNPQAYLRKG